MINIEAGPEGFILSAAGRRVLSHSRRNPCIVIGRAENLVRQVRGAFKLRRRRETATPLRAYKVVEATGDFVEIDFDGRLMMSARWKDGRLRLSFSRFDSSVDSFRLKLAASPDERIFGCGERFDRLDLKNYRVPLWVRERGMGGRSATPFPAPAFVSTKDYWCAIDCPAYTVLDFRRAYTCIDTWAVPREIVLGFQADAASLVSDMTAALGRPPAPPYWAFEGAWLGLRGGAQAMDRKLGDAIDAGAKVSAVFAPDWCGPKPGRDWAWDRELYPDLPRRISALRSRGIRFIGYVNPLLDPDGALYAEASSRGYCVKGEGGADYLVPSSSSSFAMVDLTRPEAFAWMKGVIARELIGIGMSGWMADCGEQLPADAVLASGEDGARAHNRWPVLWAKLNREAAEESGRLGDLLFFLRSGWLGSSRYAEAFWTGDQPAGFAKGGGPASLVPAALSFGLSGGGFWHSDTGGSVPFSRAKRGPERLARWMEMSAFTPFFRGNEGSRFEPSAQLWSDSAGLALFARMSGIYAELKPYHAAVAAELSEGGLPPIRHPWMHYEADPQAQRLDGQYLYGRDLMVAPSASRKPALTRLYLPDDDWVHLWTSRCFRGGRVAVESPLGYPAVFYRAASSFAPLFDALRRTARRD